MFESPKRHHSFLEPDVAMPGAAILDADEIEAALATLPHWRFDAGRRGIAADFTFADFPGAFAFMTRVALLAEKRDHHPEWSNVWNKVSVLMTTHDAGGVTGKDVEFARAMEVIAGAE